MVDGVTILPLPGMRHQDDRPGADRAGGALRLRSFVVDEANWYALAAAQSMLDEAVSPPVVLLHGPSGVGKTHLAHALARSWQATRTEARVVATTGADFARAWDRPCDDDVDSDDVNLDDGGDLHSCRPKAVAWNMVALFVLDNVDDLLGKPAAQRELCCALDVLTANGGRAIVTARRNPTQDPRISPSLASRLASGLTVPLSKPGKAGRFAILSELVHARGLSLSSVAIERLAQERTASVPELAGLLVRLDALARSEGRVLDDAFVREHVAAENAAKLTLRTITQCVAEHFGVKVADLRGPARRKEIVAARSVAIYLARQLTDESLEAIGRHFANRDHATVAYNVRKAAGELAAGDTETTQAMERIKRRLRDER